MKIRSRDRKQDEKTKGSLIKRQKERRFIEQMNELCGLVGMLSGDVKGSDRHV